MKIKFSVKSLPAPLAFNTLLAFLCLLVPLALPAQDPPQTEDAETEETDPKPDRPSTTGPVAAKLIRNYLTATGGNEAHDRVLNLRAEGLVEEAGNERRFTLVETRDGKRRLTYAWKHLGRNHKVVRAFDGLVAWEQTIEPRKQPPRVLEGIEARHFSRQRWLLHPFVLPLSARYVFRYQGAARVAGRPAHLVVAYGPDDVRSWFYFDQETFLLTRHGGIGRIGGVEEYLDYRANRFAYVDGILLPRSFDLLAENQAFGTAVFESVETNVSLDSTLFDLPSDPTPVLRSRRVD